MKEQKAAKPVCRWNEIGEEESEGARFVVAVVVEPDVNTVIFEERCLLPPLAGAPNQEVQVFPLQLPVHQLLTQNPYRGTYLRVPLYRRPSC